MTNTPLNEQLDNFIRDVTKSVPMPKSEVRRRLNRILESEKQAYASNVNRLEVIDDTGRAYVKGDIYGTPVKVELSLQDDNRTLKVFVTKAERHS